MNDTPIQIRNPDVVRDIRELAEATGKPITDVVGQAVRHELERRREARALEIDEKRAKAHALLERLWALPIVGPLLTDDDIYDEDGMPK